MRFVQVMFDGKDFVGMTASTHTDPFVELHNPAALIAAPGLNKIVPLRNSGEYVPDAVMRIPTSLCVVLEFSHTSKTLKAYQQAVSGIILPNSGIEKPKIVARMN